MKSIFTLIRKVFPGVIIAFYFLIPHLTQAQYFPPPYNVDAVITNDITIQVEISWQLDNDTALYFRVEKDGELLGGTDEHFYYDYLTEYGTFCYDVYAVYSTGTSDPAGPACVDFYMPEMSVVPQIMVHWMWPDQNYVYYATIENNGVLELNYEITGFSGSFIEEVSPTIGTVPPFGGVENIMIRWNSASYIPGTYSQDIIIESNAQWNPKDTIENIMHIYTPAFVSGVVTDAATLQPVAGVNVHAGAYLTYTIDDGSYLLWMDEGTYDLCFYKVGYVNDCILVFAVAGDTLDIDVSLETADVGVRWVTADPVDCNDPVPSYIEWSGANWLDEIIYDDGSAEDLFIWSTAGGENAVKFTPDDYPAEVFGGSFYVGDGSFPPGNWLNSDYTIYIYDENASGFPGNILDSFTGIVYNYGWLEFWSYHALIDSGNFFISVKQANPSPNSPPMGIDLDAPIVNQSYSKAPGGNWQLSSYQDFMIRAKVEFASDDSVLNYTVARMSDFDPNLGPEFATMTILLDTMSRSYTDIDFQNQPEDWYAYAVKANYDWGSSSNWTYSNIMGMDMGKIVQFIAEDCNGNPIDSLEIMMMGMDYPYYMIFDPPDTSFSFPHGLDCVWKGNYTITINKPGFQEVEFDAYIANDTLINVAIDPVFYEPRNLWVDSVSIIAYWEEPLIMALSEDFNGADFPAGWQRSSDCIGWFQTYDGSSGEWTIPAWDSRYMCVNENAQGSACSGAVDYLITPQMDLRESDDFRLEFDSYYNGQFGQVATVEYSYDLGTAWSLHYTMSPLADEWDHIEVDLSDFSGPESEPGVFFAFHSDDMGGWGSGWAVDNVEIIGGATDPDNYSVFLDGNLITIVDTLFYQFYELNYGQTYTACVTANYPCGSSDMVCVDFTSGYLRAPAWLQGDTLGVDVNLSWFMDTANVDAQLLGYNVYRDDTLLSYIPHSDEDTFLYTDANPDPMCYDYFVSALHDMNVYGIPGDTGESVYTGPEEVCLVYGTFLPVFEDWSSGNFSTFWNADDHWVINGQFGNPNPGAEFKWDPVLLDYHSALTSGPINGVCLDSTKQKSFDGQIMLEFDISLEDNGATGTEILKVEIWKEGNWYEVASFTNANGSFDWKSESIDISSFALGYVFKLRFMAEGENSMNIQSWFVDNIEIYHFCAPPFDLWADQWMNYPDILLMWSPPYQPGNEVGWISWDDGTCVDGIGLTGGGTFSVASKWDPDSLAAYSGMQISKIRFIPDQSAVDASFIVKVWEGDEAETLLHEQLVENYVTGEWNEVILSNPVPFDISKELWFGYTVTHPDGEIPVGHDDGPAIAGFGDMLSFDGVSWDPISSMGWDLNWNVQAWLVYSDKDANTTLPDDITLAGEKGSKSIVGYNIFGNVTDGGYEYIDFTEDTSYLYEYLGGSILSFVVSAVYESCESGFSNEAWAFVGIDENKPDDGIRIFPNPSKNEINIQSTSSISQLCLLDLSGRVMECKELQNQTQSKFDVSAYEAGVYLLRIDTEYGRVVKKIVIAR